MVLTFAMTMINLQYRKCGWPCVFVLDEEWRLSNAVGLNGAVLKRLCYTCAERQKQVSVASARSSFDFNS
jgi:hypothetical protein